MNSEDIYRDYLNNINFQMRAKIFVQKEQFEHWLRKLFCINESLHKEYDLFYQEIYYVLLTEMLKEGKIYLDKVVGIVNEQDNWHKKEFYNRLQSALNKIASEFTPLEFEYIKLKRHNTCHIFQNNYEVVQNSGKIKTMHKVYSYDGKCTPIELTELELGFYEILKKHGGDIGFDTYVRSKVYPILNNLQKELMEIHSDEKQKTTNING